MSDKRVCMTIPQQECRETRVPSCQNVTREQVIPASDWSTVTILSFNWSIISVPGCAEGAVCPGDQ